MRASEILISPNPSSLKLTLNRPLQLGIMASGSGSNFEAVAQAIAEDKLNAQIKVLIYNNPNAKVRLRAEKYDIPSVIRPNFDIF